MSRDDRHPVSLSRALTRPRPRARSPPEDWRDSDHPRRRSGRQLREGSAPTQGQHQRLAGGTRCRRRSGGGEDELRPRHAATGMWAARRSAATNADAKSRRRLDNRWPGPSRTGTTQPARFPTSARLLKVGMGPNEFGSLALRRVLSTFSIACGAEFLEDGGVGGEVRVVHDPSPTATCLSDTSNGNREHSVDLLLDR
jgi:hypothetical protein